jgi:hypothetical protein
MTVFRKKQRIVHLWKGHDARFHRCIVPMCVCNNTSSPYS